VVMCLGCGLDCRSRFYSWSFVVLVGCVGCAGVVYPVAASDCDFEWRSGVFLFSRIVGLVFVGECWAFVRRCGPWSEWICPRLFVPVVWDGCGVLEGLLMFSILRLSGVMFMSGQVVELWVF
jgi:hypothetical protein